MTLVRKMAVFCDGCGARQDVEWREGRVLFGTLATAGTEIEGWRDVGKLPHT